MTLSIAIIDDDAEIRELLSYHLQKEGMKTKDFDNAADALDYILREKPDAVVTDWMMPEMDGLDFARKMKFNLDTEGIPLMMISCKNEESDVVTTLEFGFDDYMSKPFRIKEFVARMKRMIKRKKEMAETREKRKQAQQLENFIVRGELKIDSKSFSAYVKDEKLKLTFTEFKLLELLAKRPGRVFTRNEIIEKINGMNYFVTERSVDVQMVNLRKHLGPYKDYIVTVRSVGYSFKEIS
jgi:DNA-binding response OmpR family regulator